MSYDREQYIRYFQEQEDELLRAEKEAEEHKLRLQEVEEKHKQETKEKRSSLQSELNYSYYSSMGFLSLHEVTISPFNIIAT